MWLVVFCSILLQASLSFAQVSLVDTGTAQTLTNKTFTTGNVIGQGVTVAENAWSYDPATNIFILGTGAAGGQFTHNENAVFGLPALSAPFLFRSELSDTHVLGVRITGTTGTSVVGGTKDALSVGIGTEAALPAGTKADWAAGTFNVNTRQTTADKDVDGAVSIASNTNTAAGMPTTSFLSSQTIGYTTNNCGVTQEQLGVSDNHTFTRLCGNFTSDLFVVGDPITSGGFSNGANNGSFTVASIAANGKSLAITGNTLVPEGQAIGKHINGGVTAPGSYSFRNGYQKYADDLSGSEAIVGLQLACNVHSPSVLNCGYAEEVTGNFDRYINIETPAAVQASPTLYMLGFTNNNVGTTVQNGFKFTNARFTVGGDMGNNSLINASKVLVGVSSSVYDLDVVDTTAMAEIRSSTTNNSSSLAINNNSSFIIGNETSVGGSLLGGTSPWDVVLNQASNRNMRFGTNNTRRATILASGQFLIDDLKTPGTAAGKKVVCVDTINGQLITSNTGTDCS